MFRQIYIAESCTLLKLLLGRLHFAFVLIVNRRACTQTVVAVLISFALKSVFFLNLKENIKGFWLHK